MDELENDIAILTVNESFKFNSFVQPACLPTSSFQYQQGSEVVVSGFGSNDTWLEFRDSKFEREWDLPDELQALKLSLVETHRCAVPRYYESGTLPDNMVCAEYEGGGKDSCGGDSGGPLIQFVENRATLIGVVSWGLEGKKSGGGNFA